MSKSLVRVVAWNCNGKLHAKADDLLSRIAAIDIAVISECAVDVDAVGHLAKVGWTGTLPKIGNRGPRRSPGHDRALGAPPGHDRAT